MKINEWHKPAGSEGGQCCVEVMETEDGFRVRDSKDGGAGPELAFTRAEWEAFLAGVAQGEFDGEVR
jgi:hypothetical protein